MTSRTLHRTPRRKGGQEQNKKPPEIQLGPRKAVRLHTRLLDSASCPEIVYFGGLSGPPTAKRIGKGGGLRLPPFPIGFAGLLLSKPIPGLVHLRGQARGGASTVKHRRPDPHEAQISRLSNIERRSARGIWPRKKVPGMSPNLKI